MQSLKRGEICPEAQRKTKCIHLYHWNSVYTRGEWEVKSLQWINPGLWGPWRSSSRGRTWFCDQQVPLKVFKEETKIIQVIVRVNQIMMCIPGWVRTWRWPEGSQKWRQGLGKFGDYENEEEETNKKWQLVAKQWTEWGRGSDSFRIGSCPLGTRCSWATTQTKMYERGRMNLKGGFGGWRGDTVWEGVSVAMCWGSLKWRCWPWRKLTGQLVCSAGRPKFGGKYCTGERKRYRLCNVHPCRPGAPTFRQMQCSEFDTVPYKNEFYSWFPVFSAGEEWEQHIPYLGPQLLSESVCQGSVPPCKVQQEREVYRAGGLYFRRQNHCSR